MRKKKAVTFIAGVLALTLVGSTWAYYGNTSTVDNALRTSGGGDEIIEKFTPKTDWKPGDEVDKQVKVRNDGDTPLVVRVKLDETWTTAKPETKTIASTAANFLPASAAVGNQASLTDGDVTADGSVVYKKLPNLGAAANQWTYEAADGYWYYNGVIGNGASTANLLESITLCSDADMGLAGGAKVYYYTTAATEPAYTDTSANPADEGTKWVSVASPTAIPTTATYTRTVSGLDANHPGYANAGYVLTVTAETLQATEAAVDATWTTATPQALKTGTWSL